MLIQTLHYSVKLGGAGVGFATRFLGGGHRGGLGRSGLRPPGGGRGNYRKPLGAVQTLDALE